VSNKYIVYAIFALVLLQAYVGSTINAQRRWEKEHLPRLRRNKHENKPLQQAYNQYGEECIEFMPLESVDCIDLLPEREKHWIRELRRIGAALNDKISGTPGMRGKKLSAQTRRKQSIAKRGHQHNRKHYQFVSPDNTVHKVCGLKEFSRISNVSMSSLSRLASGKITSCKGWRSLKGRGV
jgi:group I intron endonuclease